MGLDKENGYTGADKIRSLALMGWRITFPPATIDNPADFTRIYLHRYHPGIDKDFVKPLSLRNELAGILRSALDEAEAEWDKGPPQRNRR